MAVSPPSKVCERCGRLNSLSESVCTRCGQRFPSPAFAALSRAVESVLGREAPMVRFYLGVCGIVYVFTAFAAGGFRILQPPLMSEAFRWGALHPALVIEEPWRLLSAMFVHFGILHLGMNMSALVALGRGLEQALGSTRFVLTFVGTGIAGFVASAAWSVLGPGAMVTTAGASGGLFGLVGFEIGYAYRGRDPRWKSALTRALVIGVLLGVFFPVNNAAHAVGGLLGAAMGYWSFKEGIWRKYAAFWSALAAIFVVASLLSIVLCHTSDVWRGLRASEIQQGLLD